MDEEIWKPVVGYEGIYQISNKWRLRNIYDPRWLKNRKEWKLVLWRIDKVWRNIVQLSKNRLIFSTTISRLVAIAFIPNPDNLPLVCHKIEDLNERWMLYNWEKNLFWGTYSDNLKDCYKKWRKNCNFHTNHPMKWMFWINSPVSKLVSQYSLEWKIIRKWESGTQVFKELWFSNQNISHCCNWRAKTAYWFIWKFTDWCKEPNLIDAKWRLIKSL